MVQKSAKFNALILQLTIINSKFLQSTQFNMIASTSSSLGNKVLDGSTSHQAQFNIPIRHSSQCTHFYRAFNVTKAQQNTRVNTAVNSEQGSPLRGLAVKGGGAESAPRRAGLPRCMIKPQSA